MKQNSLLAPCSCSCSVSILIQLGTLPSCVTSHDGLGSLILSNNQNNPYDPPEMVTGQSDLAKFSTEALSFKFTLCCVKLVLQTSQDMPLAQYPRFSKLPLQHLKFSDPIVSHFYCCFLHFKWEREFANNSCQSFCTLTCVSFEDLYIRNRTLR